jgi:DNA modification methylase
MKHEIIGNCKLYHGDSREIIQQLIDCVDVVITDPPYGVYLGEMKNGNAIRKSQISYENFTDTPEYVISIVIPIIEMSLKIAKRALITPGKRNMWVYPKPDDWGVWFNPAGASYDKWGFICAQPILYYGKDPKPGKSSSSILSSLTGGTKDIKNILHPCPKPERFMNWAVNKASIEGETVLDPFMGSGTTGIACINLKRKFIGVEIEEKYFDVACKRIKIAASQQQLDFGTGEAAV